MYLSENRKIQAKRLVKSEVNTYVVFGIKVAVNEIA